MFIHCINTLHLIDHKLRIVTCAVGQGESVLIITPQRYTMLIDGGPDTTVLDCLSQHLAYWERSLDMVILTHPHADHFSGIHYVIDRYNVRGFARHALVNTQTGFLQLEEKLNKKDITQKVLQQGDKIKTPDGILLEILGPRASFVRSHSSEVGDSASENASVISLITYGAFRYLNAGDSPIEYLLQHIPEKLDISIMQLPHHGSKTSTTQEVLSILTPEVGIASVGEKNRYGHPSGEVVSLLKKNSVPLLRTDLQGSITAISDGKMWTVDY